MKKLCINGVSYLTPAGVRDILSNQNKYEIFMERMKKKTYNKYYFFDGASSTKVLIYTSTQGKEDIGKAIKKSDYEFEIIPFGIFFFPHQVDDDYASYQKHKKSQSSMLLHYEIFGTGASYINGEIVSKGYHHIDIQKENICFPIDGFIAPSNAQTYKYMSEDGEEDGDGAVFLLEKEIRADLRGLGYELKKIPADEEYIGMEQLFTGKPNKRPTRKSQTKEESYLSLIYALSDSLVSLVKSINNDDSEITRELNKAENTTNLADYIEEKYKGYPGLSTRNTTKIFTKAKKYIREL